MKALLTAFSLLLALGCSSPTVSHFEGVTHTHNYHIQVGGCRNTQEVVSIIDSVFEEVDTCYNRWNPDSALSNSEPNSKLQTLLTLAKSYKELSLGRFDPELGGAIASWKKSLKLGKLPSTTTDAIDLDGIVKGYAIDLIIERLEGLGYQSAYVEWGGDIRVLGRHPEGRPWRVLLDTEVLEISAAIATSGNTEQQWHVDGKTYTHIVDPCSKQALEVQEPFTVTVQAPTCALADALATAAMTWNDPEKAHSYLSKIQLINKDLAFSVKKYP